MIKCLKPIEVDVLNLILSGGNEQSKTLKSQLEKICSVEREFTGAGYFLEFSVNRCIPFTKEKNYSLGDVHAEVRGMETGLGFVLFVRNGVIECLECYSYGEEMIWPIKNYTLKNLDEEKTE